MDKQVIITMSEGKFEYLKSTLNNHKDFIHRLGMPEVIKDSLIKDTHIINTLLTTNTKGVVNG
jgi:hypothetical protein